MTRREPLLSFLAGAAIGAGLMFLLDPDRGPRRRALARDRMLRVGRHAGEDLGAKARHVMQADLDDDVIAERIRAELRRVVAQPGAVVVAVEHGVVTLTGEVAGAERDGLLVAVRWVRGVRDLEDKLETRESEAGAPGRRS
ncbi:MAG TPA: BON domain-containing protein [Gemmatimonadales bacterium]|nr:BON domain-containing protein [Gemmatimonadales bacterium]